ncbi:MAG: hypothetical protein ABJM06_13155 [Gilvibacter sp.]
MALRIVKQDNVYFLKGRLHGNGAYGIRDFFKAVLSSDDHLTINLSDLDDLDLSAAMLLNDLKIQGLMTNKTVSILHHSNEKIQGSFRQLGAQLVC